MSACIYRTWPAYLAALVAGCLSTLSFAPFHLWWLGPLAVALMYLNHHRLGTAQAMLHGWLFGIALFGTGTSWVYVSIHDYGYTSVSLAIVLTGLFVAVLALFPAICLGLYRYFTSPRLAFLSFAGIWVLAEAFRSWAFTGFPWLLLGSAQVDSPIAVWAPIGGVYLLSLIVALTGTMLVEFFRRRWWAVVPIAMIWLATLAMPVQWTHQSADPLRFALIQGNLPQLEKWSPEGQRNALEIYARMTRQLPMNVDIVVWPETALPMFASQARSYLDRLQASLPNGTALLTGIVQEDRDEHYYNAVIGIGAVQGEYRKSHLVPFGEYLPLNVMLRDVIDFFDLPMSNFSAGAGSQPPIFTHDVAIGNAICYEIVYPDLVAERARDAKVLLTVSNDTWFGRSIGPLQHLQMARLRALENGRYVVRATNNGVTAIIDDQGNLRERSPQFETTSIIGEVIPMTGLTPFSRVGSWPAWLLAALMVLPGLGERVFRRRLPW
ncbi:Apolipoprotein N-acyltransferase [Kushneria avicenniae]|uniref:Apolipoprotein N-acyltransferase n=1 Tax=Kushneria avicenniae TaxID=402385 RepID=A0A1I1JMF4_9GAMM|nr:apolipoprotein N-acyltransferase [Kushneria avicenniae]SFC49656.1 Apolipoprotein N-acyltransferase [Kushneria avicenniae]